MPYLKYNEEQASFPKNLNIVEDRILSTRVWWEYCSKFNILS